MLIILPDEPRLVATGHEGTIDKTVLIRQARPARGIRNVKHVLDDGIPRLQLEQFVIYMKEAGAD